MIKITYDSEVDAKYVSIKEGKIHETKIINDWMFLDIDEKGAVLGVEILDSSKRSFSLSTFDNELAELILPNADGEIESLNKMNQNNKNQYVASTEIVLA
ncbi:DUF2283 domain-containing protein [Candidatus Nomurabacteria bacterium]|nr:DUF2283 domain-containing protein [Candidatus Kaiserbacteria bacterium]MCB9814184.1 DUF2283 domain-containing protein [Candidatus Nomurabacteria bacterium]